MLFVQRVESSRPSAGLTTTGTQTSSANFPTKNDDAVKLLTGTNTNDPRTGPLTYTRQAKLKGGTTNSKLTTTTADTQNSLDTQQNPIDTQDSPLLIIKEAPDTVPGKELTEEEKQEVKELQERDREVRQHEQAHKNALGPYAKGGIHYDFTRGPDDKQYAIGGHVKVDLSEEDTPEKTEAKMRTIKRAALAPQQPSSADRQVAATATQKEQESKRESRTEDTQPSLVPGPL